MAGKPKKDVSLKIVVLGAAGTGKTCFIERYCRGSFHSHEIGDVTIKTLKTKGMRFTISVWDTSNKKLLPPPGNTSPTSFVARGAHGAVVLYDITNTETLYELERDIAQFINTASEGAQMLLVGNKSDLAADSRAVSIRDAGAFARHHSMAGVLEVSAKKNRGLEQAMDLLIEAVYKELVLRSVESSVKVGTSHHEPEPSRRRRRKCVCS